MSASLSWDNLFHFLALLMRGGGLFLTMPLFGGPGVPSHVKVGLAALVAGLLFPVIPMQTPAPLETVELVLVVAQELGVGLGMGFIVSLFLYALQVAGQLMDVPIGFGMVNVLDPHFGGQIPIMGQFLNILAVLVFFSINGHHAVLRAFADSYALIPIGAAAWDGAIAEVALAHGRGYVFARRAHCGPGRRRDVFDRRGVGHRQPSSASNQRFHYRLPDQNFSRHFSDRSGAAGVCRPVRRRIRRWRRHDAVAVAIYPGNLKFDLQLFAQEKTEPATPKRREEARKKGQVARTAELGTAVVLLAGFGVLSVWASGAGATLMDLAAHYLGSGLRLEPNVGAVQGLFIDLVLGAAMVVAPFAVVALVVGVAAQLVQVGFMATGEGLKPKFERINPIEGAKRLFSRRALVNLLKSLAKIFVVGYIAYVEVRKALDLLPMLTSAPLVDAVGIVGEIVLRIGLYVGLALLIVAGLDYLFQRLEHERSLRMSRQEVKEELKQTEGDPQLRARIRRRQRELASRRMMQEVPTADVVVTNPVHLAVALRYDQATMDAPIVVAKGAGIVARRIKEIAQEHNVPIVENVTLARSLFDSVELGQPIPVDLYQAVADVLAFVYRMRRRRR